MSSGPQASDKQTPDAIDMWLQNAGGNGPAPLSDEELAARLASTTPAPSSAAPGMRLKDALSATLTDEHAQDSAVDLAVKTAANGVKVLAPLLNAIAKWMPPEQSDQIPALMGKVLERVRVDTSAVTTAFGVNPDDSPAWLTSQVSGMIMPIVVNALERNNGIILDINDRDYLTPILDLASKAKDAGLNSPLQPISTEWQLIQCLASATADVMTEYHAFSYFHSEPAVVAQYITDYLQERVVLGTLGDLTSQWGLNDKERAYLGSSLIAHAGKIMAQAWTQQIPFTMEALKDQPPSVRSHTLVNGYPLDHVFDAFERVYRGIEVSTESALRSMAPARERFNHANSNAPGLR